MNHVGAGNIVTIYSPPERKYNLTISGIIIGEFFESLETVNAPDNVPIECAKNGNIKYLRSQFIAFIGSRLSDIGTIIHPQIINPILTIIPT